MPRYRTARDFVEAQYVRVGLKTLVPLAFCAAAAASAAAHFIIDVLGDYALKHDSYDHLRHGSREVVACVALVLAAMLAGRGLRVCCEIAARNRTRILPRAGSVHEQLAFLFNAVAATVVLVPAMEWLDGRSGGMPVRALDDAFGGSLLLGLATTVVCALMIGAAVYHLARWLISHHDSIATIIETFLRAAEGSTRPCEFDLTRQRITPRRRRTPHALALSKRGPPEMLFT